jgi:hypothetical protein
MCLSLGIVGHGLLRRVPADRTKQMKPTPSGAGSAPRRFSFLRVSTAAGPALDTKTFLDLPPGGGYTL